MHWVILALVFPGVVYLLFAAGMRAEGKTHAANELTRITLWVMGVYTTLIVLSVVFAAVVGRFAR